jgi:FkbM family methyltransferase
MIIFDVGANDGRSCCHFANDNNNKVYAFEPTPQLVEAHLKKYAKDNYVIIQKAVTNYNGTAKFNIAGQADWGCSSLYEFNDNLDKTWPGRWDFVKTAVIDVECITMKSFIEENNIPVVDFLHCDNTGQRLVGAPII